MRDRKKIAAELADRLSRDYAAFEDVYIIAGKVRLMLDQDDADERWEEDMLKANPHWGGAG